MFKNIPVLVLAFGLASPALAVEKLNEKPLKTLTEKECQDKIKTSVLEKLKLKSPDAKNPQVTAFRKLKVDAVSFAEDFFLYEVETGDESQERSWLVVVDNYQEACTVMGLHLAHND